ncbi:MAG: FAD-dependent oxidoreductase [Ruminococcaceae bacterium]|nr:FAD-dependent oxidoreductase [Oscillospiraceae bacterium]
MFITEQERKIPIGGQYDVIVAGGGIAGISAALAAARQGKSVLLLEKMFMLGGLATAGLVTIYLPICDGNGRQVSFGIAEELLRLSVKLGYEPYMDGTAKEGKPRGIAWLTGDEEGKKKRRFEVQFNANVFAILCEQLLLENGVKILYGTSVCATVLENKKITAVITENKSGRIAYKGKSFVDASGDADLCYLSGAKTEGFKQGNILASWYYEMIDSEYRLKMLGFADIPDKYKKAEDKSKKRYTGLDAQEISDMVCDSHENLLNHFLENGGINKDHALTNIASIPQLRMTRRIVGVYTLNDEEVFKSFPDSIGMISDWRKAGPVYEIPFSCLYGKDIKNLITCGRCISVTDDMWDISRVIPPCAVTGEAAGIAAAISDDFANLDYNILAEKLKQANVKLHLDEI